MKLVLTSYLHNMEHCVEYMLSSVVPFVDGSCILIDDRTTDRTKEICMDYGCKTRYFKFANFAKTRNESLAWVKEGSDWHVLLGGDEILDKSSGPLLRDSVIKAETGGFTKPRAKKKGEDYTQSSGFGIECIGVLRTEWDNIDMRGEPMWQNRAVGWTQYLATDPRLSKSSEYPRLHAVAYTHAQLKNCIKFVTDERLIIHHFRYYWEKALNKNSQDKIDYYKFLNQLQGLEGGRDIWPDKRGR